LPIFVDDASVVGRVAALEAQLANKTLEQHFREQTELIDRLFAYRFGEFERKQDEKLDAKLRPINETLQIILSRLPQ